MGFYSFTSTTLTVIGYLILVYRIVFELQSNNKTKTKPSRLQKLCTKWLIFTIFLKIETYLLAVLQIIPFGTLSLLAIKILLFLPENKISHMIYKKIQRKLEKIKLEEYQSQFGSILSLCSKFAVKLLMRVIKKIAAYICSKDIEEIEEQILDIIKILEYKKAAINLRSQAIPSEIQNQLNTTDFSMSVEDEDEHMKAKMKESPDKKGYEKSKIGEQMSKILVDFDDDEETLKLTGNIWSNAAQLMIVRPDRKKNQKAVYEEVFIQYYLMTSKVTFTNQNKAVENGTLEEIRWVTKNMMNIEMVLKQGRSKIILLSDRSDVAKWVEPILLNIKKLKEDA